MSDQEAEYRAREQRFSADAERHAARSRTVSNLRGLSFAVFIVSLLLSVFGKTNTLAGPGNKGIRVICQNYFFAKPLSFK